METKAFKFEVKAVEDSGEFEGYASTFQNEDTYGDIIEKGAFADTLNKWKQKGKPIPVLWQHNPSEPIGITVDAYEDSKGLAVRGKLLMGIEKAREAYEALKADVLGGLSIGFNIPKDRWMYDAERNVRIIRAVNLWEYSLVTWPANEEAIITGVKQASHPDLEPLVSELKELTAALRGVASVSQHQQATLNAATSDLSSLQALIAEAKANFKQRSN